MAGPYNSPRLPNLRCLGVGLVPKKDGLWRVIYHLSAPMGDSINDYIDAENFSLSYCSISMVKRLGRGALMRKIDIRSAFRLCPVCPQDWELLWLTWRGKFYIDKCLPFGLRSAAYLFNQVAEALEWIMKYDHGVDNPIHYLDDFFTAADPDLNTCFVFLSTLQEVCSELGVPVKPEKVEGP